jgi:hypothetical protein
MSVAIRCAFVGALMFAATAQAQNAQSTDASAPPAAAATASAAAPAAVAPQAVAPAAAASTAQIAPTTAAASSTTNASSAAVPAGKVSTPPEGKGQIVFFREKKFVGAAVNFKVREGEKELGKLSFGSYFVATVDPGKHDYTVHSEAKDTLHMEVEAGETYYVIGSISMGFLVGRPNLAPSDKTEFDHVADGLKLAN